MMRVEYPPILNHEGSGLSIALSLTLRALSGHAKESLLYTHCMIASSIALRSFTVIENLSMCNARIQDPYDCSGAKVPLDYQGATHRVILWIKHHFHL